MTIKLYESYGVLANEYRPVYTDDKPITESYNVITVSIPAEYPISKNEAGETLIDINGDTYLLSDVLTNHDDAPCIKWYDGEHDYRVMLEVIK